MRRFAVGACILLGPAASAQVARTVPRVVTEARINPADALSFSADLWPSTVYVGQQATYEIGIFLSEEMRARLRSNPQFVPPDVESTLSVDLPLPPGPLRRVEGGRTYDVHVFSRALFPLAAGRNRIAPARLTYAVPLGSSYFSREETHSARSQSLTLVAREPPLAGRPADYQGAVGQLGLSARIDTARARIGDPVLMTVTVSGIGNISLFPRPALAVPWAQAVPGAERVHIDSSSYLVRGRKEFEYVVTPRRAGALTIPAVRYPYFNPYTEQYEIALAPPVPLLVVGGSLAGVGPEDAEVEARLPIRRVYRGSITPPVTAEPFFWGLLAVAPFPAIVFGLRRQKPRERFRAPTGRLQQLAAERADVAPRDLRRALTEALEHRIGKSAAALGDPPRLERALRRSGVSVEAARDLGRIARELNESAFSAHGPMGEDLAQRAARAFARVDEEARPHGPSPAWRAGVTSIVLCLTSAGALLAAAEDSDRETFAQGVAAYEAGQLDAALGLFLRVARSAPRAADAWANAGTAAWHASDTATAVRGWQKALRLEPLAADMRARLSTSPGFTQGFPGEIPAIPVLVLAIAGLLAWGAGCVGLALRNRSANRWAGPSVPALVIGACVVLSAVAAQRHLDGADRVVVTAADRLRPVPAFGASATALSGASIMTGETARQLSREGGWTRVRFDDGRDGWIETAHVASLSIAED